MQHELLFEIGTEEIPAAFIPGALEHLRTRFRDQLEKLGIPGVEVKSLGTPRRLVVHATGIPTERPRVSKTLLGPPKKAAYDPEGRLTKAGEGFARAQGVSVDQLFVEETPKGAYLAVVKEEGGEAVRPLLEGLLPELLRSIPFRKSMRWADRDLRFARPIHWIVATFAGEVVDFEIEGIRSGAESTGMRFFGPRHFPASDLETWQAGCRAAHIVPDPAVRRQYIREQLEAQASRAGYRVELDEDLLDEATYLTECPRVVTGSFDPAFLSMPAALPVTVMKHHQRYFAVYASDGSLAPRFMAVINTPAEDVSRIVHGNERVLRARLTDGKFFWEEDLKTPLVESVKKLEGIIFHAKLGSSFEKVQRLGRLAAWLSARVFPENVSMRAHVERAALLAKADLVTRAVSEFPELQGTMGSIYARQNGEIEVVAKAIAEHYLPTSGGGALPTGDVGAIVSIADKLDSLVGFIGVGLAPSAAADPFALRRGALGILNILIDRGWDLGLGEAVDAALEGLKDRVKRPAAEVRAEVLEFFRVRLRGLLTSDGAPTDLVDAVISAGYERAPDVAKRLAALRKLSASGDFAQLMIAFRRAVNITRDQPDAGESVLEGLPPVEAELYGAFLNLRGRFAEDVERREYDQAMGRLLALKGPIDRFFEGVLVMDPDETIRARRLAILHRISALFRGVADLSRISTDIAG